MVVKVDHEMVTISYGPPTQALTKKLDRYQDDLIKSTKEFIYSRKAWTKDSEIEVYSHQKCIWCQGIIEEVLPAKGNINREIDVFQVFCPEDNDEYTDPYKYVDRWSPYLRMVQDLDDKMKKYKIGTKVIVWSNSKLCWFVGVIVDLSKLRL